MARKKNSKPARPAALPFEQQIEDVRNRLQKLESLAGQTSHDVSEEIAFYRERLETLTKEVYAGLSSWNRVQVARHPNRPLTSDFLKTVFTDFVELHGDGFYGDDPAMVTGLAKLGEHSCLVIGQRKGRNVKERLACHFGSAHPEGYRKALRKMHLAERMNLPIVCLINTPGAYPGIGAEERGQARAIAENIHEMFSLRVPILVMVIGEGGSGGALGIAIGDRVGMMENAWYSVISPEGCASILWRDAEGKEAAADALKLTATDMYRLGLVDQIVPEPVGGAHAHPQDAMELVKVQLETWLTELQAIPTEALLEARYLKFRHIAAQGSPVTAAISAQDNLAEADPVSGSDEVSGSGVEPDSRSGQGEVPSSTLTRTPGPPPRHRN